MSLRWRPVLFNAPVLLLVVICVAIGFLRNLWRVWMEQAVGGWK